MKPSLTQFTLYGPLANTPLYDRVEKENRLRVSVKDDADEYCRRSGGFFCMIKHPAMSYAELEGLQRWCFDEYFQRLGPSIYRVVDTWLAGYRTLRDSENPILRSKAHRFAMDLRKSYPIFLPGRVFGPNPAVRAWIADLERQVYDELGGPALREKAMAAASLAMAQCRTQLVFDFKKLQVSEAKTLKTMREKLSRHRDTVRLVMPKLAHAHPELLILAKIFQQYRNSGGGM